MPINKDLESIREIFQEGNEVDGFLIGEPIHKGGMAVLYQATKEGFDYPILVKVPRVGRDQPVESLIGFETELNIMKAIKSLMFQESLVLAIWRKNHTSPWSI